MQSSNAVTVEEAVTRFVLVAQARTGGHLLVDLLNSHPNIHCDNEPFLPRWRDNPFRIKRLLRKILPFRYVEKREKFFPLSLYGFKLLINQVLFPEKFIADLDRKGWKIIFLKRRNIVCQVASLLIARKTNEWHRESPDAIHRQKVILDHRDLLEQLKWQEKISAREKTILKNHPHIRIGYEEELSSPERYQETLERAFEYLSVPSCVVTTKFLAIHSEGLREYIQNYDELLRVLENTQYAGFLDA